MYCRAFRPVRVWNRYKPERRASRDLEVVRYRSSCRRIVDAQDGDAAEVTVEEVTQGIVSTVECVGHRVDSHFDICSELEKCLSVGASVSSNTAQLAFLE